MKLILSRHGNTFNPGEPAVWVGSQNDLPLVEAGIAQAKLLGECLRKAMIKPTAVYCGPLQRTKVYAELVLAELNLAIKPLVDPRLNEVDYGKWTGLTNEQIRQQFGDAELEAWEKLSRWPASAGWQDSAEMMTQQIRAFSADIINTYDNDATILVVSSNGRLRYFLDLVPGEFNRHIKTQSFKIATGNICQLSYAQDKWNINFWNQKPFNGFAV